MNIILYIIFLLNCIYGYNLKRSNTYYINNYNNNFMSIHRYNYKPQILLYNYQYNNTNYKYIYVYL
jgi:hypothetical protein